MKNLLRAILPILCILLLATTAPAMDYKDTAALAGLTATKGVFLIDSDNPEKTALYLNIIKGTYQSMAAQQVKPDFVVVFIGPTVRFLSTQPAVELAKNREALTAIAHSVQELGKLGVKQEICAIATEFFKVPNNTVLPGLEIIGNGFTSLIGYQNKGYALVPIF